VAARVTAALSVPTIGIGSGPQCDGQVLVLHDVLGLTEGRSPRFVKRYADVGAQIQVALERFAAEVRSGTFPEDAHTYGIPDDELARFEAGLGARDP
jgi:3-methyl-2-oxobutanoate hydroxymethyltransferase